MSDSSRVSRSPSLSEPENPERIAMYQGRYVSILVGHGYEESEKRTAFLKLMEGKEYGEGPLLSAWAWFCKGWDDEAPSSVRSETQKPLPTVADALKGTFVEGLEHCVRMLRINGFEKAAKAVEFQLRVMGEDTPPTDKNSEPIAWAEYDRDGNLIGVTHVKPKDGFWPCKPLYLAPSAIRKPCTFPGCCETDPQRVPCEWRECPMRRSDSRADQK